MINNKKIQSIISFAMSLLLFGVLFFASCYAGNRYEVRDYVMEVEFSRSDFRILQLSDLHLSNKDNLDKQFAFIDLTIRDANADLIIVTGDVFSLAEKKTARDLFAFLDSYGIPWTVTFGNHDEQGYFPIEWLTSVLNEYGSNCVFKDISDDDVYGNSNFAINLVKSGSVKWQLIVMDSNRYYFGDYFGYDYIKQDQIDWYKRVVDETKSQNGGTVVPSVAFFHIPLPEFKDAFDKIGSADASLEYGEQNEAPCPPEYNSGLFDMIKQLGSTKAIVVGHDHVNNYRVKYEDIYLCYGIKSTDRVYYDDDMLGGQVFVLSEDGSISFEPPIYHTYEEVRL